jgi:dihydrofolate reductase
VAGNAQGGSHLLFGRITYDMMASWWPTPGAQASQPEVARAMNALPKTVVSRTLSRATWNNTTVLKGELTAAVRTLKQGVADITILGSGSIVAQLTRAGLVDEYQLVIVPLVLAAGRRLFEGPETAMRLRLHSSRAFRNGNLFLVYERVPAADFAKETT